MSHTANCTYTQTVSTVEYVPKELRNDEKMLFAVKEVNQLQHIVFVGVSVRVDVLE